MEDGEFDEDEGSVLLVFLTAVIVLLAVLAFGVADWLGEMLRFYL